MASTVLVPVQIQDRGYDIVIGSNLIGLLQTWSDIGGGQSAVIVTNGTVDALYGRQLFQALSGRFQHVSVVALPDGEAYKTWESLNTIFDHLLTRALDRRTVLFALGGGVVGDITGFAAACYMRGVPFVQVPTTLLAQVDSSVGGKTAINHPMGKNMIGAIYQPVRVVADLDTLRTLPAREIAAGLAEVIKYGPIADDGFFKWIEGHIDELLDGQVNALSYAIQRSCEIKASVVSQDERESGLRAILNFGHTFGHAIEAGLGYGEWLHGEAVGCGMVMAADLSVRMGLIDDAYSSRIRRLVQRTGLPIRGPRLGFNRYLELMGRDKKSEGGEIRFVVIDAPGHAIVRSAPDTLVRAAIDNNTE